MGGPVGEKALLAGSCVRRRGHGREWRSDPAPLRPAWSDLARPPSPV